MNGEGASLTYEIEKLEYGIGLEFQPVVLSPGRISLKVRTAVSEPTTEGSVGFSTGFEGQIPGANMLSIRKRLADTTVELPSGGSMMIAGLVRDDVRQAVNGFPGLSKIPVLGTLVPQPRLRTQRDRAGHHRHALSGAAGGAQRRSPSRTTTSMPPSDGAGMFLGRVNRVYGTMKTDLPNGRYHGVVGYIYK